MNAGRTLQVLRPLLFRCVTNGFLLLFGVFLVICEAGNAVEAIETGDADEADVGVIDQLVTLSFYPKQVILLLETSVGNVRRYSGMFVSATQEKPVGDRYLLGSPIPRTLLSRLPDPVRYVFFIIDDQGNMATTPVRQLSKKALLRNGRAVRVLVDYVNAAALQLKEEDEALRTLLENTRPVRERASQIAGVDDIIDLKMELAKLQGFDEENVAEVSRLKTLVERGRNLPDMPNLYPLIQELSLHLEEAAKVTAMADRLNTRRRETALSGLQKKLALVKEAKNYDREALARDVLRLRERRRELERQLHITTPGFSNDF